MLAGKTKATCKRKASSKDEKKESKAKKPKASGKDEETERKEADRLFKDLPMSLTGLRAGETIKGITAVTKGTRMRLAPHCFIPPQLEDVERALKYRDIAVRVLQKLSTIPAFAGMSIDEREAYLKGEAKKHACSSKKKLNDMADLVPGVAFEMLDVGAESNLANEEKVDVDKLSDLLENGSAADIAGNGQDATTLYVLPSDVRGCFLPSASKTQGGRTTGRDTLWGYRSYWAITNDCDLCTTEVKGVPVVHVLSSVILSEYKYDAKNPEHIYVLGGLAIVVPPPLTMPRASVDTPAPASAAIETMDEKEDDVEAAPAPRQSFVAWWKDHVIDLADSQFSDKYVGGYEVRQATRAWFAAFAKHANPADWKSLQQKIKRRRPVHLILTPLREGDQPIKIPAAYALVLVFAYLVTHRGALVPSIHRLVTGRESALKRAVIAMFEDSYVAKEDLPTVVGMVSCVFLAQRVANWRPADDLLKIWMELLVKTLAQPRAYVYDTAEGQAIDKFTLPACVSAETHPVVMISAFLDDIKSFAGDLALVRFLAHGYADAEGEVKTVKNSDRPDSMDVYEFVDAHCRPEVIYYLPLAILAELQDSKKASARFGRVMGKMFRESGGVNPRRQAKQQEEEKAAAVFRQELRHAQWMCFQAIFRGRDGAETESKEMDVDAGTRTEAEVKTQVIEHTFEDQWLAGIIGAIPVVVDRIKINVTLDLHNLSEMQARRCVSARMTETELSKEQQEVAIEQARTILGSDGVRVDRRVVPMEEWIGKTVYYDALQEEYMLGEDTWNTARHVQVKVPLKLLSVGQRLMTRLQDGVIMADSHQHYIGENAAHVLTRFCATVSKSALRTAVALLSNPAATGRIKMKGVARNGGGLPRSGPVTLDDLAAFQILLRISTVFPAAFRLAPHQSTAFQLWSVPIVHHIRNIIEGFLQARDGAKIAMPVAGPPLWAPIVEQKGKERTKYEHQQGVQDEMMGRILAGQRSNFLCMDAGAGKTKPILDVLEQLRLLGRLPSKVLWATPPSAIASLINELHIYGLEGKVVVLHPIKSKDKSDLGKTVKVTRKTDLEEGKITIIKHDHVRLCAQDLIDQAPETFCVFDEVHKMMNKDTQRSSLSMRIAESAAFSVALTGTPTTDNHWWKLAYWLQQLVPFMVTENNLWAVVGAMAARRFKLSIKIDQQDVQVDFPNLEVQHRYETLWMARKYRESYKMSLDILSDAFAAKVKELLENKATGNGVLIATADETHQKTVAERIGQFVSAEDMFLVTKDSSLNYTGVEGEATHPYKVVICTMDKVEGWNCTALHVLLKSYYPCNYAKEEQLLAREWRIGQKAKEITVYNMHVGVFSTIKDRHLYASNISAVLKSLQGEVVM